MAWRGGPPYKYTMRHCGYRVEEERFEEALPVVTEELAALSSAGFSGASSSGPRAGGGSNDMTLTLREFEVAEPPHGCQ